MGHRVGSGPWTGEEEMTSLLPGRADGAPRLLAISRRPGWRSRLAETIEARRRLPHAWGRNDCALFAADCIAAMTGTDPAASMRGRYRSASGAARMLKEGGHADLRALAASLLEEIAPAHARAGDVAAFRVGPPEDRPSWALGVVTGERVTVLRPDGLGTLPLTDAAVAFRVP